MIYAYMIVGWRSSGTGESQQVAAAQISWERREGDKEREEKRKKGHNKTISFHDCKGNNKRSLLCYREPTLQYPPVSFCQLGRVKEKKGDEGKTHLL